MIRQVQIMQRAKALYPAGHMRRVWIRNMLYLISREKHLLQGARKWIPS